MEEKKITAAMVKDYLGMAPKEFMAEWKALSDADKDWYRNELAKIIK